MPNNLSSESILAALGKVQEPELQRDLVTLKMIRDIEIKDGTVSFTIVVDHSRLPTQGQHRETGTPGGNGHPGRQIGQHQNGCQRPE